MPLSRLNPQLTDYIDHLCIMRTWLGPLERWLSTSRAPFPTSPPCAPQTSLIDADLAEAGMFDMGAHEDAATSHWPAHATEPYHWGARYVIEGSRLGASVLYHRLVDALRPHKLRYLQGAIETSTGRWPRFLRELRASVQTPTDVNEACTGACASFDALLAICAPESETS
jgi:heme oxygenase